MSILPIICSPFGGASSHLRWLLFLDNKFIGLPGSGNTVGEKLNFIKEHVYSERTWYNWINKENIWRDSLDTQMLVSHPGAYSNQPNLVLYLRFYNINLVTNHYFHVHPTLNGRTFSEFKKESNDWNGYGLDVISRNINGALDKKIIFADNLYEKVLSESFYQTIIDFFDLENNYESAKIVQELYYNCRTNSAKEFYDFFTSNEFTEHMTYMKQLGDTSNG